MAPTTYSANQKRIAKTLGVTPTGLELLWCASVRVDGHTLDLNESLSSLMERGLIELRAYLSGWLALFITDAGRKIVEQARGLGW